MKVQSKACGGNRSHELGICSAAEGVRISKHKPENGDNEMQQCFHKLKEIVPTVPHNKKLSKVQLLQHVIDYIMDLELTLEFDPAVSAAATSLLQSVERRPLVESTQVNTQQVGTDNNISQITLFILYLMRWRGKIRFPPQSTY